MNEYARLKSLLEEDSIENSMLSQEFSIDSKTLPFNMNCQIAYTGDSKIQLKLTWDPKMDLIQNYITTHAFKELSEDQFNEAATKLQNAVEDAINSFENNLNIKLESYGLQGE